jgi:membrane protease YdiL (CAAX protease family)
VSWDFTLILIVLAVAVPLLGKRRIRQLMEMPETSKRDRLRLYASTVGSQWFATGVVLWRSMAHGISPAEMGIGVPRVVLTVFVSVILCALILGNQLVSLRQLALRPDEMTGMLPQLALRIFPQDNAERAAFALVVGTVSMCEEVIYRGFVQTVLEKWSGGSILLGVAGAAVFFGIAHIYQGRRGVLATLVVGGIFSVTRVWTGSLIPAVISHFAADSVVGFMAPGRLRAALRDGEKAHLFYILYI